VTTLTSESPTWFSGLTHARVVRGTPYEATAICHDSRSVKPGAVFVAVHGLTLDGNTFIADAIQRGARYVVVQESHERTWSKYVTDDVAFVTVPDTRIALAEAAAGFYSHPARDLCMTGVTGTDGKTTTTHLIAHVLNATGLRAGYLSSVEFGVGGSIETNATHMTTVEANEVQRYLAKIRDAGGKHAVVEASSIGLDMHRVDQCEFDVGVFTNLSPDHLDYHGGISEYRDAKAILFRMLNETRDKGVGRGAVLNADDAVSDYLRTVTTVPVVTYALNGKADITAREVRPDGFGTWFIARMFGQDMPVRTALLGSYNAANCIAATAAAVVQGAEFGAAVQSLESFPGVPGRMELIDEGQPYRVVVDIASTGQAMSNVLRMLRPITPGKLIVLFGAAGERDAARRRTIARAVADVADHAVITNEDPRSEVPDKIVDEVENAFKSVGFRKYDRELDRRQAIEIAFRCAEKGDTVLLAGKGTEQSIVIGNTHWPWDERRIAREVLQDLR
jgi:UDP-N-acetylmuramoyl-L-alanyl-D-glutamate--2,6-diaminopimelate ligase